MRVINISESLAVVQGITIPAGQHRNVRDFDPENPRNQSMLADGKIQVPDLEVVSQAVDDAPEDDLEDESEETVSSWFRG